MTAVEFLEQELDKNFEIRGNSFLFDKILKQSKEMEKEQKIEFAKNCLQENDCFFDIEQYHNKTFKSE